MTLAKTDSPYMAAPSYPVPCDLPEWTIRRESTRAKLQVLLGDLPPRPEKPRVTVVGHERRTGFRVEKLSIDNEVGAMIPALLLVPDGEGPFPAILFCHWHAGQFTLGKEELWQNVPGGDEQRGEALARRGYVVLAIDAYAFGERAGTGPGGPKERGGEEQSSLSKLNLWQGRSLWGMMVRDDRIALDVLSSRPEVDPRRIGATGISMGSSRSWWLAALDERIAATVGVCCLTRYEELVRTGDLCQHGIYYFVPGLLRHFDMEAVTSLIAPRAFLTLSGADDAGSPAAGVEKINRYCNDVYRLYGQPERFRGEIYPGVGHTYTPVMWLEMLAWFDRHLAPKQ